MIRAPRKSAKTSRDEVAELSDALVEQIGVANKLQDTKRRQVALLPQQTCAQTSLSKREGVR